MIYSLDLLPVETKPTRITNHTATLIDLIYTNNVNRLTSGIITVDISDHQSFVWLTHLSKSKIDKESYLHDVDTIDWNAITEQCNDLHEVTARNIKLMQLN